MATKKNLNANAENGSLLSINGLVVINADDQRITKINGNILTILPYKLKLKLFLYNFRPNLSIY